MKNINERIKETEDKLIKLIDLKHKQCPHKNVKLSGGGIWNDWPDWGYDSRIAKCLDCGLRATDDDIDQSIYYQLKKLVTVDKSSRETFGSRADY